MDTAVLLYEKFILQKVNYKKIYIYKTGRKNTKP
jgi:hypothetical protein